MLNCDVPGLNEPLQRIFAEFREMPGLALTESQAIRLFGLPPAECRLVLGFLVDAGVLARSSDGTYRSRAGLVMPA